MKAAVNDSRSETFRLACVWCGAERPLDLHSFCLKCGGTLEIRGGAGIEPRSVVSLWGYSEALPVPQRVSLGEGATPLIRLIAGGTGDELYAKAEWMNPTGSFKDRGSAVAVSAAVELGAQGVVCASTGNNGASVSAYAARAGLPSLVVLPAGTSPEKVFQARLHGATIVEVGGTFSDAYSVAAAIAAADARWANLTSTFVNPYMTAAHSTIAYEIVADLERAPGTVIIPIGAGPMLVGIRDGFRRLAARGMIDRDTVLVGVQAAGCAPIVRAYDSGADEVAAWPDAVASCAGSINDPLVGYAADGTRTLNVIRDAGGMVLAVDDADILAAMHDLASHEGIGCEPAAAATLAALRRLDAVRPLPRPVVLVCSGHALKDTSVATRAEVVRVGRHADPAELLVLATRTPADTNRD